MWVLIEKQPMLGICANFLTADPKILLTLQCLAPRLYEPSEDHDV